MLRQYQKLLDAVHVAATGGLIVAAYVVLYGFMADRPAPLRPLHEYTTTIGIFTLSVLFSMSQRKFSALNPLAGPISLLKELGLCYAFGLLGHAFAAYTFKLPHLSRMYVFGGMAWSYVPVAAWHLGTQALYRTMRTRGWNVKKALLIGDKLTLPSVSGELEIAGTLDLDEPGGPGSVAQAGELLDSLVVDYVIFTAYRPHPEAANVMLACQERGIEIWLRPDFLPEGLSFSRFDYLHDIPLFVFSLGPRDGLTILLKRLIDIAASLALLVLMSLPMLLAAFLIRRTSRGPILFKQPRIGLNGRKFLMYKFRSMREDSPGPRVGPPGPRVGPPGPEARPAARGRPLQNALKGPVFKMADDPRVTPLGKILRKYSIDELPQLWNVLAGDMSLVGPRPPLPSEVNEYEGRQRRRLSMRPGITGLWQVGGRNALCDFDDWVKLDLTYIDGWSLWLDFKILLMTIPAVVKGTGV